MSARRNFASLVIQNVPSDDSDQTARISEVTFPQVGAQFILPFSFSDINCVPKSQSGKGGASINYNCNLLYIDTVTQIRIPELNFRKEDTDGINGILNVNNHVMLEVNMAADEEIIVSFKNINCSHEGSLTIEVNNKTNDGIFLRIVSK